uniref:Transcription initiation factor TFIID subunit 11 n=1 Tax=Arcella intermedia TaxID=1963864 RepID=A0A6B2LQJ3_9EUKA
MVKQFTQEQMNRHESYKRSAFQKSSIKKYMTQVSGAKINQNTVIVMAGISKIFVGEVVEAAREVMEEWGDEGPIKVTHLREAYQRMKLDGRIPYTRHSDHLFKPHV